MAAVELFTFENSLLCINKYNSNKIQMGLTTSPFLDLSELLVSFLNVQKRVNRSPPQLFDFYSNSILFLLVNKTFC